MKAGGYESRLVVLTGRNVLDVGGIRTIRASVQVPKRLLEEDLILNVVIGEGLLGWLRCTSNSSRNAEARRYSFVSW